MAEDSQAELGRGQDGVSGQAEVDDEPDHAPLLHPAVRRARDTVRRLHSVLRATKNS